MDVVVPVLNEAHVLERSIETLHEFFVRHVPLDWRLVIAENGSTDGTVQVAELLSKRLDRVDQLSIHQRGRGRALRTAWMRSGADILAYTDVDLSTELEAFPRLFRALIDRECDLAVGSRLAPGARTTRSLQRTLISRAYNQFLRWSLHVGVSDAQTGFKAMTREVVDRVLPLVKDESWFFDTELLVLSEALGYRIVDLPVRWVEDTDSRVEIIRTAWDDVRGVVRLRKTLRSDRWNQATMTARRQPRPEDLR